MTCPHCHARPIEDGIDECRFCAVDLMESGHHELESYGVTFRPTVLAWIAEVESARTQRMQEACGVAMAQRQAS